MRKKVIIGIIAAAVVVTGAVGGRELSLKRAENKAMAVNVVKNEAAAKKKAAEKKAESDKKAAEAKQKEEQKQKAEEAKKAEEKKNEEKKAAEAEEKKKNQAAGESKQNNQTTEKANHAQTLEEGYALCSKMWNAYNSEHFDEAVRLYESITNKDAIAKIGPDKFKIYHGQQMNREIAKAQGYYNAGNYHKARVYIREIINGNLLLPDQAQRAQTLFDNAKNKVSADEEKKINAAFTNEKAVQLIKEKVGCGPHDTFSDFHSEENPYVGKIIHVVLHKNGEKLNVIFYKVSINGTVLEEE